MWSRICEASCAVRVVLAIPNCAGSAIAVCYYKMQRDGLSRRRFLQSGTGVVAVAGGASLGLAGGRLAAAASTPVKGGNAMAQPTDFFAYVGSRTTRERNARGEGINVYRVDAKTAQWTHVQLIAGL